jgi:hypothetical protein
MRYEDQEEHFSWFGNTEPTAGSVIASFDGAAWF